MLTYANLKVKPVKLTFTLTFYGIFSNSNFDLNFFTLHYKYY